MFELSKDFRFDAAHTLKRSIDADSSRRIHGHSYRAQVVVRGIPDPATGMIMDLGALDAAMASARDGLDHRFLDEVVDLGPATMENLALWVWRTLEPHCKGLARVVIYRDASGESCAYFGEPA
ncbi:6-pyruvoyl trahydropterin synthase family protein [Sphingomonas phyllosphaerae]|uniref:6-pyruvoyl trahydropterin synthase family protein n=1 Tax=Sphingomonas phyllosphaerae TaxID=257003 RepID=UPI0003B7A948|nr:6-carboxytetrahydropterin synthase [Sphingomonas phyllosphaerae]